jgi:hypothetical protein
MSKKEFSILSSGSILSNDKNHAKAGCYTDSIGFCFLGEDTNGFDPVRCYEFLSGIVCDDVLVEFETDETNLQESWGQYADPYGSFFDTFCITEYCTCSYSIDTFKPIRYTCDVDYCRNIKTVKWYDFN